MTLTKILQIALEKLCVRFIKVCDKLFLLTTRKHLIVLMDECRLVCLFQVASTVKIQINAYSSLFKL